jgi:hypothetical protein
MSDFSKTQKKKFPECDHIGYGKYCHLCKQLKTGELVKEGNKYYPKKIKNKKVNHEKRE